MLETSRYYREFLRIEEDHIVNTESFSADALRPQIEDCVESQNIDLVTGGDAKAARLPAELKPGIPVPIFPPAPVGVFDRLNNKWSFYLLCKELGLPMPRTWLFRDKKEILEAIAAGGLPERLIAKPTNLSGEVGIFRFNTSNAESQLDLIDYAPVLVQEFIDGRDIDLSVFAAHGSITAALGYHRSGQTYFFELNDAFLGHAATLARHLQVDGILNFDARLTRDGEVCLIECNPRTYSSMDYSMIAGINFIEAGWPAERKGAGRRSGEMAKLPLVTVKSLYGVLQSALRPWRLSRASVARAMSQ